MDSWLNSLQSMSEAAGHELFTIFFALAEGMGDLLCLE
jgi:hypothetical protein